VLPRLNPIQEGFDVATLGDRSRESRDLLSPAPRAPPGRRSGRVGGRVQFAEDAAHRAPDGQPSRDERRVLMVHAVCDRP